MWIIAGLMAALVAGISAYAITAQLAPAPEGEEALAVQTEMVVVAAKEIGVRELVVEEDVDLKEMPIELVPPGAIRTKEDAIGKVAMATIFEGEVLVEGRLTIPTIITQENVAIVMDEDQLVFALPILDLMSRIDVLKSGDKVDVLISMMVKKEEAGAAEAGAAPEEELRTAQTLQNVELSAMVVSMVETREGELVPGAAKAILIAMDPQDALVLKHLIDAGAIIDLALRAPTREEPFETEMVNLDYILDRFTLRPEVVR